MTSQVRKQITVLSGKGGTGKTTFTGALAQLSSPIALLADCDVDAPNLHLLLNPINTSSERFFSGKLAVKDESKCTSCGTCLDLCRFDGISSDFEIDPFHCEGCGVCAWACPDKAIVLEVQASGTIYEAKTRFGPLIHARLDIGAENSGKLVSEVIQKSHDNAHHLQKELIIVDGSPGIGCPVIAALANASLVIIVVEPTSTAIHDMKRTIELVRFFKLPLAVVINKATINEDQRVNIIRFCEDEGITILGELPYIMDIYRAMVNRQTVIEYGIQGLKDPLKEIWLKISNILDLNRE
ncbi:MAG: ATP-binding protein [Candidatus Heimdallarchaeota archaeon]|nr:MAG: ATP-binding protein [Candidatus Heimdallarchaeota archaeon]